MVCEVGNQQHESNDSNFFHEKTPEMELCEIESSVLRVQELLEVRPNDFLGLLQASPVIEDTRILRGTQHDVLEYYEKPPTIGFISADEIGKDRWKDNFFTTDANAAAANGVFISEPKGFLSVAHSMHHRLQKIAQIEDNFNPNFLSHALFDITFIRFDDNFIPLSPEARDNLTENTSVASIIPEEVDINGKLVQVIGYDEGGEYIDEHKGLKVISGVAIRVSYEMEDAMLEFFGDIDREHRGSFENQYIYRLPNSEESYMKGVSGAGVFIDGKFVGTHTSNSKIGGMHFGIFTGINEIRDEVISRTRGG